MWIFWIHCTLYRNFPVNFVVNAWVIHESHCFIHCFKEGIGWSHMGQWRNYFLEKWFCIFFQIKNIVNGLVMSYGAARMVIFFSLSIDYIDCIDLVRRFEFFSTFFLLFFILTFDFLYLKYEGQCLVVTSPNKCFLLRSVKACHINSGIYGFCFIFPWQKPWCRFPYICQFKSFDANSFMQSNIFFASSDLI